MKKAYLLMVLLTVFVGYYASAVNVNVSGIISSNTTWNADTVKITGDVTISNGVTLTVSAGTYVQAQGHYKIDVKGRIVAQGTATNKITFTALSQSVGWSGMRFENTAYTNDTSIIDYCVFSYGKANAGTSNDKSGGAIFMYNFSKLKIRNSIFSNNYASYYGGAIALEYKASPKIYNCLIVNNSSGSTGGGVDIYSQSNPTLINNTIAYNTSSNGGGLWTYNFSGAVTNCIIYENSASNSSQIYGSPQNVNNCDVQGGYVLGSNNYDTIPGFVAAASGAGSSYDGLSADYSLDSTSYLIDKGANVLSESDFINFDVDGNFRFDNRKADIGAYEYITSTEVCGTISSNTTWSGNILMNCDVTIANGVTLTISPGADIIVTGHHKLDVKGRLLSQGTKDNFISFTAWNHDEGWLGIHFVSVAASNDTSKIEYSKISYKKDLSSTYPNYYGALFIRYTSKVLIRNNIISNNHSKYGGGVFLYNSNAKVVSNLIINNSSYYFGAGMYISGSSSYSPQITNNTIANNKSTNYSQGVGIYKSSSVTPVFKNNIIYGNQDNSGNHALIDNVYPTSGLNITNSCIEGGYSGSGNISSSPLFKNPTPTAGVGYNIDNYNFALQPTSPCIDAGASSTSGLNLPTYDLAGKTRNYSSAIDMGAYEDKSSLAVCGTISANQTWDANTININCDVTIPDGVTVTIVPGTKVLFSSTGHYKIYVKGALQALGAESDSILFTAVNTTTGWDGVQIDDPNEYTNDSCIFNYCKFEYGIRTPSSYYLAGGAVSSKLNKELRIENCRFSNNQALGSYGYGAALSIRYLHGSDYESRKINNNTFDHNTGKYGILDLSYSNITLKNNKFYSNTVTHSTGKTFYCSYSGGLFEKNIFSNNTNPYGAMYISGEYSDYKPRVYNNIIVNNDGTFAGGLYIIEAKPEVYNNTIANNYASVSSKAGGVYFYGNADANFKSNIIYGNKVLGGVSIQICIDDVSADPKFYNNDIQGGILAFSGTGSGISYSGVHTGNIDETPIFTSPSTDAGTSYNGLTADWSLAQGSALINAGYSNSSNIGLSSTDYDGNDRIYNGRIDIGAFENQQPIVAPCTISDDTEWEADTIRVSCNMTINSLKKLTIKPGTVVLFTGHYGIDVQGAIEAIGTPNDKIYFMVNDTTGFEDSSSTAGSWDGINFNSVLALNDSSKFSNCVFMYGKAESTAGYTYRNGGAMNIYNSPKVSISNCLFSNNKAYYYGGAIYIESSNIKFFNNVIVNNTAGYNGGGLFFDDFTGEFINNTVANNRARFYGGMRAMSSEITISNSIFWGNRAFYYSSSSTGYNSQLGFYSSNNSKIYNSDIQYGKYKVGYGTQLSVYQDNIDSDPLFKNPSQGTGTPYIGYASNFDVNSNSPVLNAGKSNTLMVSNDFAGNSRTVADTIDIGAYEIQLSTQFIDVQPVNNEICEGLSGTFAAHATVSANYQWQKNGLNIPGATSNILSKSAVALSDSGTYNCIISNAFGSISTDTSELFVLSAPSITSSPASANECLGSSVTFTAGAQGSEPLTYQWYNTNGALGSGASNQSFEIGNDTIRNAANNYPTPFANYFWGNKEQYLILASELTAAGLTAGEISSLGFDVYAPNSCPTLSNFNVKIGATTSTSLTNTWLTGLATVYSVASYQVTSGWNNFGFTTSFTWDGTSNVVVEICSNNSSWITNGNASVNQSNTSFYSSHCYYQDNTTTICSSTATSFRVQRRPNVKFTGASSSSGTSTYSINSISANSASNYYMIATNTCGIAQSTGATLGINYAPGLTPISASDDICEDASYAYSTTTSQGTSPITYQWFKDGSAIAAATSLTYNITSGDTADAGIYYCKATNACGSDSTNQSILVVNEKPQISSQSSSQTVCENQSVTLGVTATGTGPLTYQWYVGATPVSGATNNTYTISAVSTTDAGTYYCKVSNGCVSTPITSTGIILTVNTAPSISSQTGTVEVCSGSAAPFSITATGTPTLTYQWYNSSGNIASATNNTYTISSAATSDAGNYYCVVTNSCGNATSNQIPLTVNSAPSITSQPSTITRCENQSAVFNIQNTGTTPISYQWYKGSTAVTGATNSNYLISPVSSSDAATYYCKATNSCGTAQSNTAQLTVNVGPTISSQSSSTTICENASPTFQVTTSGTSPITYQWYDDNGVISGATNSTYSLTSADTSDAGIYYCIATNSCSSATSNSIVLTVNESPTINTQPSSSVVCENLSAVFNVSASGTSPLSYQWYDGNGLISGATNSSYLIPQASTSNAGNYYVKVTNSCGNVQSNTASLTVNSNVSITSQSSSTTVCDGSSPSFSITASGTSPITYQWYKDNLAISSATNNSLSLTSVDTSDAATYYAIATNSCNSAQSNQMVLTVNESPTITTQPSSSTVCEGSSVQLSVAATGTAPITYQWYKGATAITGATNLNYLISAASSTDGGSYYVKVTNGCGVATSTSATLTVNSPVVLTAQSSSTTVCDGSSPSFSITASGTSPITYQWYKDNLAISSATNNSLSLTSVDTSDAATYYAIATNSCNSAQSNQMVLTVNESPTITTQPVSSTVCQGSSALLSISATGTAPMTYQWYKGSTAITGATSSSYLIGSASSSEAGSYYCTVSNSCGNQTSNTATLSVHNLVSIVSQTGDSTQCAGSSNTFSITASGSSPISYQWYYNGTAITGATSASYTIVSVANSDGGDYYCIATNSCNSVQSTTKTLTVNTSPTIMQQSTSSTVCNGSSLTLNVAASGTNPISYQWYKGSSAISGAINSNLPMYQISTSDAGIYHCEVINACGSVNSNNMTLTVNQAPTITAQTNSTSVCENSNMTMSVTANGTAPMTYQWYNGSGSISGATNNTYTINSVDTSDADTYYCVVTNSCDTASSNNIVLTVNQAPTITAQSTGATKCMGSSFSFSVSAIGTSPITYQWYNGNGAITGATNSLYIINALDTLDAGTYYCVVSNSCGTATSNNKTLIVNQAPSIISQSNSATKCEGTSMLFTLTASGSSPLSYQWYADTGAITGANANSYTISSVVAANAGNYYAVVSNGCGNVTSATKTLTVHSAPTIIVQTGDDTLCENQSMVFNITTIGTSPISYQWYKSSTLIPAATNNIYMIASVDTTDAATYYAIATNSCGSDQSNNIVLTVNKLAQITYQSGDSSRCEGENMTFDVQATGTAPLAYQWFKSGAQISGATSNSYGLTGVTNADAGYYHCVISNSCNAVNTTNKILTVHNNPQIILDADTTFCDGGKVTLSPGYGYNCIWNTGSYNNQIQVTQTGDYWVHVTDQYGCSGNSDTASINVVLPYANQELCMVGVDSATQKNLIVWEKTPNVGVVAYNIYRESSTTGVWNLVETKPYDSLSVSYDLTSNPVAHADRYAITVLDSCGNESPKSTIHKTMHLAVSPAVPSGYNLTWNGYQGFTVGSYRIWKADTSLVWKMVDSVNGNIFMWHDTTSLVAPFWYQVEVIRPGGPCNPTKANTNYNTSRSNTASNGLSTPTTLTPNFIATPTQGVAPLVVVFYDQTGGAPTSWFWNFGDGTTSTNQNPAHQYDSTGVYDVTLTVTNADGANSITKFAFIDVLVDGIELSNNAIDVQVFPNPYTNNTNIAYTLVNNSNVDIKVYSSVGQLVATLYSGEQSAGPHKYSFSAASHGFSAGVYYLRMTIDDKTITKKLIEVK